MYRTLRKNDLGNSTDHRWVNVRKHCLHRQKYSYEEFRKLCWKIPAQGFRPQFCLLANLRHAFQIENTKIRSCKTTFAPAPKRNSSTLLIRLLCVRHFFQAFTTTWKVSDSAIWRLRRVLTPYMFYFAFSRESCSAAKPARLFEICLRRRSGFSSCLYTTKPNSTIQLYIKIYRGVSSLTFGVCPSRYNSTSMPCTCFPDISFLHMEEGISIS